MLVHRQGLALASMVICGSSCSHRPRIGPAPRFGTAPVEWELAIVDLLLVARLDAKSLLGSVGRLVVAAYASASGATSGAANPTSI
jgi:hypothetical protein